jgi:hypothetical protein
LKYLAFSILLVGCATQDLSIAPQEALPQPIPQKADKIDQEVALLQDCSKINSQLLSAPQENETQRPSPVVRIYDSNGDKRLSQLERKSFGEDLTIRCEKQYSAAVSVFDLDKSGDLSLEEWDAFKDNLQQERKAQHELQKQGTPNQTHEAKKEHHQLALTLYDADQDGSLSETERASLQADQRAWIRMEKENPFSLKMQKPLLVMLLSQALNEKHEAHPNGPPPAAVEACEEKSEGELCEFEGKEKRREGSCVQGKNKLVCRPDGLPPIK